MRLIFISLLFLAFLSSCSVPTLESTRCLAAQGSLKKLLSLHFDRGFKGNSDYRKLRDKYITERLKGEIDSKKGFDYLTQTSDFPKAFRIGGCTEKGKDDVALGVLLFWKDNKRDEQRSIEVEMKYENGNWLVDKVAPSK